MSDRARRWLGDHGADAEAIERLARYVAMLIDENARQNLIARSTEVDIWWRHIVDSAQLARWCDGDVADLGSGAGLPGVVLGCLGHRVTLVEPRRKRAEFLVRCVDALGLRADVRQAAAERLAGEFTTVTARALGSLDMIFAVAEQLPGNARLVLPRGIGGRDELDDAQKRWTGLFHVEPSVTNADSSIIVASEIRRRG